MRDSDGCKALTRDHCDNNVCLDCSTLGLDEFAALQVLHHDDICWFYGTCKEIVSNLMKSKKACADTDHQLSNVIVKLNDIERKVSHHSSANIIEGVESLEAKLNTITGKIADMNGELPEKMKLSYAEMTTNHSKDKQTADLVVQNIVKKTLEWMSNKKETVSKIS